MSEKKILNINPDLFTFNSNNNTNNKTKKNNVNNKIKIKSEVKNPEKNTLKKRSILRMIRQQQNEKYEKMLQDKETPKPTVNINNDFKSEFKKAEEYLNNLTQTTTREMKHNRTIKNHNNLNTNYTNNIETIEKPLINVNTNVNNLNDNMSNSTIINNEKIIPANNSYVIPKYGCLKNGNLPTYRSYLNQTKKNNTNITDNNIQIPNRNNDNIINNTLQKPLLSLINKEKNLLKRNKKRKKIIRRTYKIGKSNNLKRVSVLVSNKTIRNNTTTKKQLLKQKPIDEIKKYLITHGFIKIGTVCPNNLMRKMYESAILICGEVQNHNSENLLYNYINNEN